MGKQFQLLRGLAILFVLLNHSIMMSLWMADRFGYRSPGLLESSVLQLLKQVGLISVPIFLFLSGAFFSFAIQNRSFARAYRAVWHNLINIFWPYLIWSAVFYLMIALLLGEYYTVFGYIKNIITGYPFNFVPLLIVFYIAAPVLVWVSRRYPAGMLVVILAYQLFLANDFQPGTLGFVSPEWTHDLTPPIVRATLSKWAIFFPIGIIYQQYSSRLNSKLQAAAPVFILGSILFFLLSVLHEVGILHFPIATIAFPIFAIPLVHFVRRNMTALCRWVEEVGRKSYGLYLTNLTTITICLFTIQAVFPPLLGMYFLLIPLLFALALYIPLGIMRLFEMPAHRSLYRYVFG